MHVRNALALVGIAGLLAIPVAAAAQSGSAVVASANGGVHWIIPLPNAFGVEVVNQLLRAVQEGEKAAAADPAALPWVEAALQAADGKRRHGEKLFFTERFSAWPWVLLNGVVTLLLGISIWRQWPESSLWVIGLFVGIDLIFNGWSWVMLALAARSSMPQNR